MVELATALRRQLPPEEFAKVLADKAREGAPWACAIIADRYWPKTTRIDGKLSAGSREGPYVEPFVTTAEAERATSPPRGATH